MSQARTIFVNQMRIFRSTIAHEALIDGAINERERNGRAQVLRNGLAVICFSAFEDFLRRRVREIFTSFTSNGISFNAFSEDFRILATIRALDGIRNRAKHSNSKQDSINLVQHETRKIGSSLSIPFEFSDYVFGFERSNIEWENIANLLRVLNSPKPADAVGCMADRCGIGVIIRTGAKQAFDDLAQARHRAAHDPTAIIQPSNLDDYYIKYVGLAVSLDAIISSICLMAKRGGAHFEFSKQKFAPEHIDIYFVDDNGNQRYGYMKSTSKRYFKKNLSIEEARSGALKISRQKIALIVERDPRKFPIDWDFPGL